MATVSARVPDEIKDKASEAELNLSKIIREAVEKELKKKRRQELIRESEEISTKIQKLDEKDLAKQVRDDRQR